VVNHSLSEISAWVDGRLIGDPHLSIRGVAPLDTAEVGDITFLANPKYQAMAGSTRASAVIARETIDGVGAAFLLVADPYYAFAQVLSRFHPPRRDPPGQDPRTAIAPDVVLGLGVSIGPFVTVASGAKIGDNVCLGAGVFVGEGSEIGEGTRLYPNVTIREGVRIGKRVIIHSGSVIGGDGFGFAPHAGSYFKVPQVGGVIIEDDVELGSNVTVDRATLGNTIIGRGTKVDNLVQIAHNVVIGPDTIIVAQVGISGSVQIGRHVTLAGQVGVTGHLKIGDDVVVGTKSGVTRDIPAGSRVTGFPTLPHQEWLKATVAWEALPEMRREIRRLRAELRQLQGRSQQ
jgi:UDP-3-O-[3-hydroxymyristoyl] glucosamine N-acyltransferase